MEAVEVWRAQYLLCVGLCPKHDFAGTQLEFEYKIVVVALWKINLVPEIGRTDRG